VCRGSSLWFSSFGFVVQALFLSLFCLGCVEPLPLPKGTETCPSSSDLVLCLPFVFLSLVDVSFGCLFSFLFSLVIQMCVLSMNSSRGD
jgi:hypothetical protein